MSNMTEGFEEFYGCGGVGGTWLLISEGDGYLVPDGADIFWG